MKTIRVGVIGIGRGQSFMGGAAAAGMKLVAICDQWEERVRDVSKRYEVTGYTDYDKFLEHDMDAVVLANYFHEHTPFAIKALRAGKHVMSETSACSTLAEGVQLCREVEKSGKIYMFAENYPFTAANLEMERLYKAGKIGEARYADGEYNHPGPPGDRSLAPTKDHWRNLIPSTYYCSHALAPLMQITDTMPVLVNGFSIAAWKPKDSYRRGDTGSVIICRMDNGAVFRLFGLCMGGHSIWYRVHGDRGLMETMRGGGYAGPGGLHVALEPWHCKPGERPSEVYPPQFPKWAKNASRAGHGGGDYFTNYFFAKAIRTGKQPYLDVYRGVAMSVVGILAWKSALQDGAPFAMPDFRKETDRRRVAKDTWSPFTGSAPCSILEK